MTTETKRDLTADLALCEAVPEVYYDEGGGYTSLPLSEESTQFFEQASEGWPYAIRRAIAAEKKWAKLREVVVTNATGGGGEDINDYDIMLNVMDEIEAEVTEDGAA